MQQKQSNLVLVIGDFFIPTRCPDLPDKFKELLVPNRLQHVICTGNVGAQSTLNWLRDLSGNFTMAKGDEDEVGEFPESKVVTVGKFKIGVVHGHQIVPWGDDEALSNYARELDCDILVYGHTHQSKASSFSGKFLVNPGTATGAYSSLMIDNNPSFCLFDVLEDSVDVYFYEYKGGKVQISKTTLKDSKVEPII